MTRTRNSEMTAEERNELEALLGYHFEKCEMLDRALTHRSHRQNTNAVDNERLEFLGDRVLGLVASEELSRMFPEWDSGQLSKGLARIVSASSIYIAARRLNLGDHLRLGAGEEKTGGREKKRLLADAYEAIVGAIYLDAGLAPASAFLHRTLFATVLAERIEGLESPDHKSALQEWLQRSGRGTVEYRVQNESGPQHQKTFEVEVWMGGKKWASSTGLTKKEAEQSAARLALESMEASGEVA